MAITTLGPTEAGTTTEMPSQKTNEFITTFEQLVTSNPVSTTGQHEENVTTFVGDNCKTSTSGRCFWIEYMDRHINFSEANSTCASHGSVLAVIPDRMTYDEIVQGARRILQENNDGKTQSRKFLLGMTYNPANNKMYPDGAFKGNWYINHPKSNPNFTRVLVAVRLDTRSSWQGLMNLEPTGRQKYRGVVCWKPRMVSYGGTTIPVQVLSTTSQHEKDAVSTTAELELKVTRNSALVLSTTSPQLQDDIATSAGTNEPASTSGLGRTSNKKAATETCNYALPITLGILLIISIGVVIFCLYRKKKIACKRNCC